ncbi:Protein msta, isoform A [Melipona quadrifasciata]|uniref:Protein msta, isoform A n=1 Tax=Melipona quadrifasciata TaxID=166423 RepID=A0A0N0BFD1_9HYME|nr:Protein msta, isoform A [Melipona quadrifasciata]
MEDTKSIAVPTLKYKVDYSEKLGRYLQATTDLQPGEVIFREEPIIVGPITSNKNLVCFACMSILLFEEKEEQYFCSKCTVAPLCGSACEEHSKHHTPDECELFKTNKDQLQLTLSCVTDTLLILRIWLLKKRDPKLWERVKSMEAHLDKRRDTEVWENREIYVVAMLKSLNLVPDDDPSVSEVLQLICGIVDVNSFQLRPPGRKEGLCLRGLFMEASLLSHNCRGNLYLTTDSNFKLTVYASVPIKKGDTICFNYSTPLLGALARRQHLKETKYFECDCSMCSDRYEMESYISSILCPRCKKGYVGMEDPLTKFPYKMKWICNKCEHRMGGCLVKTTLNLCKSLIDKVDNQDAKELEILKRKLLNTLHRNHYLILLVKQKLLTIYRLEATKSNPKKRFMENMLDVCKEMYELLEIIEPGISRFKGKYFLAMILYEWHLPIMWLANRAHCREQIPTMELISRLEECASVLKKSLTILLLESSDTPEGKLARQGLQKLKTLNALIADAKAISKFENLTFRERRKLHKI